MFGVLAALSWAVASYADTVVLAGKPPFRNVEIVGLRDGRLRFRGVCREILSKPLREVVRLELDSCPALSKAEALAEIDVHAAIAAYEQAADEAGDDWPRTLVHARLLGVYDRAGRFDAAAALYVSLTSEQPELASQCRPRYPAPPGSEANRRARERLLGAIEPSRSQAVPAALRTLAFELLLFDEVDPLPPGFAPPTPQPARGSTSQPAALPPLLFGDTPRRSGAPPRLPADSLVLEGARRALAEADVARAARLVERSLPYVAESDAPAWRLLRGRCLIEQGQPARAADELLALTRPPHDRSLAAEALYYVGLAHERMGRADAAEIYRELLRKDGIPAETQRLAVQGLKRLGE